MPKFKEGTSLICRERKRSKYQQARYGNLFCLFRSLATLSGSRHRGEPSPADL